MHETTGKHAFWKADFHVNGIRWNLERFWTVFSYPIYDFFFQQQEMDAGMMVRVWILGESLIVCPPDDKLINRETLETRAECTSCDTENIRIISGTLSRVNLAWEKTKPQAATSVNFVVLWSVCASDLCYNWCLHNQQSWKIPDVQGFLLL